MSTRRGFLSLLLGVAVGITVDPDQLLWIPGKKLISIPKPAVLADLETPISLIISDAYRNLGILPYGEPVGRREYEFALREVNRMLDGWKSSRLPSGYDLAGRLAPVYDIHMPGAYA